MRTSTAILDPAAGSHGGTAEGASHYGLPDFLQRFIDSDTGVAGAIFMHTAGVFVFVAGLGFAAFRVWRAAENSPLAARDVRVARLFMWGGLGLNVAGGAMRLVQSDHPTLTSLGTNPWVQIILVKHLFWLTLVGVTFVLLHRSLPRLVQAGVAPVGDPQRYAGARRRAFHAAALVLIVALAGASASAVGPLGHAPEEEIENPPGQSSSARVLVNRTRIDLFNGTLTGTPIQSGRSEAPVIVPANATEIVVSIAWDNATATLRLGLVDPEGIPKGTSTNGPTTASIRHASPAAGTWKAVITTDRALQESYRGRAQVNYTEEVPFETMPTPPPADHGHPVIEPDSRPPQEMPTCRSCD